MRFRALWAPLELGMASTAGHIEAPDVPRALEAARQQLPGVPLLLLTVAGDIAWSPNDNGPPLEGPSPAPVVEL